MAATALQQRHARALLRRLHHHAQYRARRLIRRLPRTKQHAKGTALLGRELQAADISRTQRRNGPDLSSARETPTRLAHSSESFLTFEHPCPPQYCLAGSRAQRLFEG